MALAELTQHACTWAFDTSTEAHAGCATSAWDTNDVNHLHRPFQNGAFK